MSQFRTNFCLFASIWMLLPIAVMAQQPPVGVNDEYELAEGGTLNADGMGDNAPGLLANDSDSDGDSLFVGTQPVESPAHGTLQIMPNGHFVYEHDGSESTSDHFEYIVLDHPTGLSDTVTVTLTINPINDPPVAENDFVPIPATRLEIRVDSTNSYLKSLLDNDSDAEGDALTINVVSIPDPRYGSFIPRHVVTREGTFVYRRDSASVADGAFRLIDQFSYMLSDGQEESNEAIVYLIDEREYRCLEELRRLKQEGFFTLIDIEDPEVFDNACEFVAQLIDGIEALPQIDAALPGATVGGLPPLSEALGSRDLQSQTAFTTGNSGTVWQNQATPSSEPVPLVAGSASAIGSDGGKDGIAALTLNPSLLYVDENDPAKTAKWGRLVDITLLVPVNNLAAGNNNNSDGTATNTDTDNNYFGVRARLSFTGLKKGSKIYNDVVSSYDAINKASGITIQTITDILRNFPFDEEIRFCTDALIAAAAGETDTAVASAACHAPFAFAGSEALYADFKRKIQEAVFEGEKEYGGVSLEADFGDPTLGAVDSSSGTALQLMVAYGKRLSNSTYLRTRLGIRHHTLDDFEDSNFTSVEGQIGFENRKSMDLQQVVLAIGLDFRYYMGDQQNSILNFDERLQTNYTYLRWSLSIPISEQYHISVNYGYPIHGELGSTLGFNASWRLSLPE